MRDLELSKAYNKFFNEICQAFQEDNVKMFDSAGKEVPVSFPYLTYQVVDTNNHESALVQVNIWSKSSSYVELATLTDELDDRIGEGSIINMSGGRGTIYLTKGSPFSQNVNDPEEGNIKRKLINLEVQVTY